MNAVSEKDLALLSRAEKMQMLQWLVKDLGDGFAGVESRPGVCGVRLVL